MIRNRRGDSAGAQDLRGVWLAIILLGGAVAGVVVALSLGAMGAVPVVAACSGGAAFLGTGTLGLTARRFLDQQR